jgi:ABC-type iron transport system FetAB permease component
MKVIRNYLYNAGYQILLMIAPLVTTPYVSRALGAHASGINTYTNGWVTVFYLVGQMGLAYTETEKLPITGMISGNARESFGELKHFNCARLASL